MKKIFAGLLALIIVSVLQAQNLGDWYIGKTLQIGRRGYVTGNDSWLNIGDTTGTKGFTLPRVTARTNVPSPRFGLMVYDKSDDNLWYHDRLAWRRINLPGIDSVKTDTSNLLGSVKTVLVADAIYKFVVGRVGSGGGSQTLQQVLTTGSTLTTNNTVNIGTNRLSLTGSAVNSGNFGVLLVNNTDGTNGSGYAISASASDGHAIIGQSNSGNGIRGVSNSGAGGSFFSTNGVGVGAWVFGGPLAIDAQASPTTNNTVTNIMKLYGNTSHGSFVGANGIGIAIDFPIITSNGSSNMSANRIVSQWTNATHASRTAKFTIKGTGNAVESDWLAIDPAYAYLHNDTVATRAYARSVSGGGGSEPDTATFLIPKSVTSRIPSSKYFDNAAYYFTALPETDSTVQYVAINSSGRLVRANKVTIDTTTAVTGLATKGYVSNFIDGYNAKYNNQTGTSYTLQASDNNKIVTINNASAITLTVPTGLPVGFNCTVLQLGSGKITFASSGTTINNRQNHGRTAGAYAVASIISISTNTFVTGGDMEVAP